MIVSDCMWKAFWWVEFIRLEIMEWRDNALPYASLVILSFAPTRHRSTKRPILELICGDSRTDLLKSHRKQVPTSAAIIRSSLDNSASGQIIHVGSNQLRHLGVRHPLGPRFPNRGLDLKEGCGSKILGSHIRVGGRWGRAATRRVANAQKWNWRTSVGLCEWWLNESRNLTSI